MKHVSCFSVSVAFFGQVCGNSGQNYVIEGTLPSVKYDGEWIYLVPMENAPGRVDSVKITNASFSFSGQGEEMRVLRLRHLLRIYIQELLVVTEAGNHTCEGRLCRFGNGHSAK